MTSTPDRPSVPDPTRSPEPIGTLASISLDCADTVELADFYCALLGLSRLYTAPDNSVIACSDGGVAVTAMRVENHVRPTWPSSEGPKQLHLDVSVIDLDRAVTGATALGAVLAEHQPMPVLFRVLIDPAGHPFCVTTAMP